MVVEPKLLSPLSCAVVFASTPLSTSPHHSMEVLMTFICMPLNIFKIMIYGSVVRAISSSPRNRGLCKARPIIWSLECGMGRWLQSPANVLNHRFPSPSFDLLQHCDDVIRGVVAACKMASVTPIAWTLVAFSVAVLRIVMRTLMRSTMVT